jgi:hypothetical protein
MNSGVLVTGDVDGLGMSDGGAGCGMGIDIHI